MASQKNFAIKNGLTVAGTERISSSGDITGSHFGTFSGTSTTRSAGTNNTQLATTAFVTGAISDLVDSSPATLNTLNELAAALGDDAAFSTTITNSIATKAPSASPVFTGLVGIGRTPAFATLEIEGDKTTANNLQLQINGATNTNKQMIIGYDTTADKTFIINQIAGSAPVPLNIQADKVGIGTGNFTPATQLHVYHPTSHSEIRVGTSGSSDSKVPAFSINNTAVEWSIATKADNHLHFRENTSSYASRLIIADGGAVGIGVNPSGTYKLQVNGGVSLSAKSVIDSNAYFISGTNGFRWNNSTDAHNNCIMYDNGSMYVRTKLGIGIASNNPRYDLTVNGNSSTAIGIAVDNASGSSTLDIAALGSGYNSHQAAAGEVWFYSPDTINIGGATGNTNDIKFIANNSVNMIVKGANGKVGIGTSSPYSQFDVYRNSTDPYTVGSFLDYPTMGLKGPAGNGYYVGTRVTNTSGNYEWFYGATQTSTNEADFVFQGYDRGGGSYKELLRITDSGKLKLSQDAGLKMFSGYFGAGTTTTSFNVAGYGGGVMKMTAAFNHYGFISSYGCFKHAICSNGPGHGGTSIQVNDLGGEITSGNGGSWTFHRNSGDQSSYKVTKNAGTYAGGGYYYVMYEGNMGTS